MDLIEAKARGFDPGVRHPWEVARVDVVGSLIRRHAALAPGAIVMDVGCGDTYVVEQLADRSRDAVFYAIDTAFTDEIIGLYRARLNNPRILPLASLDDVPLAGKAASLVLLMDVIEHIEDDRGFLAGLRSRPCIGPETVFLVTVPAYQALFCSHDAFLGHHRRYSDRGLRAALGASGFTVVDSGYFFFSLLPIRAVQVVKERLFGLNPARPSSGLVTWNGGAAKATLLRRALALDAGASMALGRVGVRLAGLSSYAICRTSA